MIFGLSILLYKSFLSPQEQTELSFTAFESDQKIREFLLPDGTFVTLNKGSKLSFGSEFGKLSRDVILQGEALFDVIHDDLIPFKVYVNESIVEVTGTSFTISEEQDGKIRVSVMTGSVLLSSTEDQDKKVVITASHSVVADNTKEIAVAEKIPVNNLSWKTGHLIFEEMPIDSVLLDVANHFNRELTLNTSIEDKITAEFQDQPLREILSELEIVADLKFDTTGTSLIVSR